MSKIGPFRLQSGKQVVVSKKGHNTNTVTRAKSMKLTIKQRIRNWLNDDQEEDDYVALQTVETNQLDSDGMRLQIYKASGGFVVETRRFDRRTDQNINTMHVITDDQDIGEALGKIVMMEALRG